MRVAARLTGVQPPPRLRVAAVPPAGLRAKGAALLDQSYPRSAQAHDQQVYRALGILAPEATLRPLLLSAQVAPARWLYDNRARSVYVAAGAGTATRGYAIAGLVEGLEQSRYRPPRDGPRATGGGDLALATAAAVGGASSFAVRSIPGLSPPSTRATTKSAAFAQIQARFPRTAGLRLAATLYEIGGESAVANLLSDPPTTSEQVLHVDKYLEHEPPSPIELPGSAAGLTLASRDTFGELDVRTLIAVFRVPRADAVSDGWGGGSSAVYVDASGAPSTVLRLDWDSDADAVQWEQAVPAYVSAAFGAPASAACVAGTCWSGGGRAFAFTRAGRRSVLVLAPSIELGARLAVGLVP